jgi:hypothetical protein
LLKGNDTMTPSLSVPGPGKKSSRAGRRQARIGPTSDLADMAEMAVWDPADDGCDAGASLAELDRRSMAWVQYVGLAALALALVLAAVNGLAS